MDTKTTNPIKRARRRYFVELGVAVAVYAASMVLRGWLLDRPLRDAGLGWQIALAIVPLLSVVLMLVAIIRFVGAMDELWRKMHINALAIAGGATALLAVTYGLFEGRMFPHLSAWWTWSAFMISYLVSGTTIAWRVRR